MKKNIIFLVIDCFDYNTIGANQFRPSPTPFLDELKGKSFWCEKMYSQAPYTEAALIATMCGYNTLDYGGYLKRYKNAPKTLFEVFNENGYDVYSQIWTHFWPSSALRGVDEAVLRPFSFNVLWSYRFKYYSMLQKKGLMSNEDYRDVEEIIDENLNYWVKYCHLLKNNDESVQVILDNKTHYDVDADLKVIQRELLNFNKDRKKYVIDFLCQEHGHILYSLHNDECLDLKVRESTRKTISDEYKWLGEKVLRLNNRLNLKNNRLNIRSMHDYFVRSSNPINIFNKTQFSQYLRNYYKVTHYKDIMGAISENYNQRKDWLSTEKMMEYFLEWEEKRINNNKPYFAYIHTDDIHGQPTIFDTCSDNLECIRDSLDGVNSFIDKVSTDYKGNLIYDLGVLHIDNAIRWFVEQLESKKILDDTLLVITSDHGCGTKYYPLRGNIQNFHDECYHVPFIIYGKDIPVSINKDYYLTKDTMASLCDLSRIPVPISSSGISVFSGKSREYIEQEYMGPGCPDMFRIPIWMCVFDHRWKVFIKTKLMNKEFDYSIEEIFDLENDPLELRNLAKNRNAQDKVSYLIKVLQDRWQTIKNNYSREDLYAK